jgi:hypothetical protein
MFESGQADPQILEVLESELKLRSVPRAASLLAGVRRAISGAPSLPAASQEVLFEHRLAKPKQTQLPVSVEAANNAPVAKREPEPSMQVSIDDACKILKVPPNASWGSIEQSRRTIVELARPDRLGKSGEEKRQAPCFDALKANAALNALLRARRARSLFVRPAIRICFTRRKSLGTLRTMKILRGKYLLSAGRPGMRVPARLARRFSRKASRTRTRVLRNSFNRSSSRDY